MSKPLILQLEEKLLNSNENCIKYADGTMIEFCSKSNINITGADYYNFCNRSNTIDINFENTFVGNAPIVIPISDTFGVFSLNLASTTLTKFSVRVFYPSTLNLETANISYIAIGKWK